MLHLDNDSFVQSRSPPSPTYIHTHTHAHSLTHIHTQTYFKTSKSLISCKPQSSFIQCRRIHFQHIVFKKLPRDFWIQIWIIAHYLHFDHRKKHAKRTRNSHSIVYFSLNICVIVYSIQFTSALILHLILSFR